MMMKEVVKGWIGTYLGENNFFFLVGTKVELQVDKALEPEN